MSKNGASRLLVVLMGGAMAGCVGLGCVGGLPDRLPGVALGSALLLVLERAVLLAAFSLGVARSLYDAWHGRAFGMDLASPAGGNTSREEPRRRTQRSTSPAAGGRRHG